LIDMIRKMQVQVETGYAYQYGLRIARHGGLHVTGSYKTGGRSSRCLRGVYNAAMGTTVRVASMRLEGLGTRQLALRQMQRDGH
jgi:hypothetical protein